MSLKKIIQCLVLIIFIHCNEKKIPIKKGTDDVISQKNLDFKKWLNDTLTILDKEHKIDYKRVLTIGLDSLSLDIKSEFNIEVLPNTESKYKELNYAFDLLRRNSCLPNDRFKIKFVMVEYFYPSMVEQLLYEFDNEVENFEVTNSKGLITKYKFIKGNLIEKEVIRLR